MNAEPLVLFRDCSVGNALHPVLPSVSWKLLPKESWIITGPNGGGKSALAAAIAGRIPIVPAEGGEARNAFAGRAMLVSFEEAAALIESERANDESDFVEGGIDQGTTVRLFLFRSLPPEQTLLHPLGDNLENHASVRICGIGLILDRGLKRLSTGEIRRALLCRALSSGKSLIVLDDPYEGLDAASRDALAGLLDRLSIDQVDAFADSNQGTELIVVLDRWERIPAGTNRVVELRDRAISYNGGREGYEAIIASRAASRAEPTETSANGTLYEELREAEEQAGTLAGIRSAGTDQEDKNSEALVEMRNVTVAWSGCRVLDRVNWRVLPGEHWLIRGPNGSGKTTLLELIAGDNPQAFCNDVRIFGLRRGSGETVWELKARMGIVSYRLHLEYRYMNDNSLLEVLVSGFHDSIGLYRQPGDSELQIAGRWLALTGFEGRGEERFGGLSFGEQRAVLVARAAIKGPELLILDEPCHGLDDEHRRRILGLLSAIAERGGTTLLHVTHDPTEVLPCEKRILELRPGSDPSWVVLSGT
ncbi:MAG TPA: ABC transporter [Treponema sp.]|nr:MAG: hypothetical protein A2001_00575 [Treponema sp. GWC1_61_84]HCM26819.1 ABC transporter [Treponema sp.]